MAGAEHMTQDQMASPEKKLTEDRGESLLSEIYDDVENRLNPNGDDCWYCGGDGETYDCIDGCCFNADYGCAACATPCRECRIYAAAKAKAVREEVIRLGDLDTAVAWLKRIGRWDDSVTREQVEEQLSAGRRALSEGSPT